MTSYEATVRSVNSASYSKPITVLVVHAEPVGEGTGVMVTSHGWGGNRFQYAETMEWAARELDVICLSVEFRGSGYDFDSVAGRGAVLPYDASFYQLFDVFAGLRFVLDRYPTVNRRRVYHYGGSQGGHLALLSAILAPATFACVYATSPAVRVSGRLLENAGRSFEPHEASVRDVADHVEAIRCPVILEHGTADPLLPVNDHTRELQTALEHTEVEVDAEYYEGGDHFLEPTSSRFAEFKRKAPTAFRRRRVTAAPDDFAAQARVALRCADRTLIVDWSKPSDSPALVRWEPLVPTPQHGLGSDD